MCLNLRFTVSCIDLFITIQYAVFCESFAMFYVSLIYIYAIYCIRQMSLLYSISAHAISCTACHYISCLSSQCILSVTMRCVLL